MFEAHPPLHRPLLYRERSSSTSLVGGGPVQQELDPNEERPAQRKAGFRLMSEGLDRRIMVLLLKARVYANNDRESSIWHELSPCWWREGYRCRCLSSLDINRRR